MEIYKKIQAAIDIIKASDLKKSGTNDYSKYDYYTPEQVENLVYAACKKVGLLNKYDLVNTEFGLIGSVTVIDLESGEREVYKAATALAKITATNETQQFGGTMTYNERYLLMSIYGIKDNNLDPDANEPKTKKTDAKQPEKKWLNKWSDKAKTKVNPDYTKVIEGAKTKGSTLSDLQSYFNISKEIQTEVTNDLK